MRPHWGVLTVGVKGRGQVRVRPLGCGMFAPNCRITVALCDVQVHVDCAVSHKTVVQVLVLAWSCTGPCQKILWRSCRNPPQVVLPLRSCRCSALVPLWKFFQDPHRRFLHDDLVRSSWRFLFDDLLKFSPMSWYFRLWYEVLMARHNEERLVPEEVDLFLLHSYYCRIWCIDFLPPTLFGVSCLCNGWDFNHPNW